MRQPVKFPKYEELSEEERQRLLDIVGQGILDAEKAMKFPNGDPVRFDGVDEEALNAYPQMEIEDTPHVLATREESPGVFTHTIAYGRRRFVQVH